MNLTSLDQVVSKPLQVVTMFAGRGVMTPVSKDSIEYLGDGERVFRFGRGAEQSLAKRLGVTPGYMARCPADLRSVNYNYWIERTGDIGLVGRRVSDGTYDILSVARDGFVPIDNGSLVRVFIDSLQPLLKRSGLAVEDLKLVRSVQDDDTGRLMINLVLPGGRPVGRRSEGDIVECGFHLLSDPGEEAALRMTPYYLRLVCSNGMTALHGVPHATWTRRRGPGGNDKGLQAWMAEIVAAVETGVWDEHFHEMDTLADTPVEGDLARNLIRTLGRRFGDSDLTREVEDRRGTIPDDDETYWSIVNYFSGAGHDQSDTGRLRLEAAAGRVLEELHLQQYCDYCHRPLN